MSDSEVNDSHEEPFADDWLMALFVPEIVVDRSGEAAGDVEERRLPEETPNVWRVRDLRDGHRAGGLRHAGVGSVRGGKWLAREACPCGRRVHIPGVGAAPRERRRIWTRCHRERPNAIG